MIQRIYDKCIKNSTTCANTVNVTDINALIEKLTKNYEYDLKNFNILHLEVCLWQKIWVKQNDYPDSLATAIIVCDLYFTRVERRFSILRRLHYWLRVSMSTSRLSSVA